MTLIYGLQHVVSGSFSSSGSYGTGGGSLVSLGVTLPAGAMTFITWEIYDNASDRVIIFGGQPITHFSNHKVLSTQMSVLNSYVATVSFTHLISWGAFANTSYSYAGRYSIFKQVATAS